MKSQDNNLNEVISKPLKLIPAFICGIELAITLIIYSLFKHFAGLIYGEFFIIVVLAHYIHTTMKLSIPEIEKEIQESIEHEKQKNKEDIEDKQKED